MKTTAAAPMSDESPDGEELLITAKQAALRLAISPRLLWSLTNQRKIPAVRIGRSVRYSVDALRDWIRDRHRSRTQGGGSAA